MENERVRIADIADELGLSTATVSNVIHGKTKKVSPETVKRVEALLEERQYIPSMAGILLAQNDSRIIGVVVNDHKKYEGHVLEDGFIAASVNALAAEIDRAGCFMMVKTTTGWQEIAKYASMWNMVGLVLIGFCEQDYQSLRNQMHIPFVIYDGFLEEGNGLVNLVIDHFDGGRQMGGHLKALGHTRALCISDNDTDMDLLRFQGLQSELPASELMLVPMKKREREAFYRKKKEELLRFSAVFAVSDYYAADLIHFLSMEGIEVPGEISVAGFDNSMLSGQICPALTTIGQDHRKRALAAVRLLKMLRDGERPENVYTLPVQLIVRDSTMNSRETKNVEKEKRVF
ncbi:MAG: LacI family transcriptional regulator [Muribaculaceae bacterium]|nr:LacI family transcriptional regulator [Roseburia sp.]MCM1432290.1 LacI family transcriptional regulator [Muribaculaceae bacterium]MCM1494094.1 LacI family transcriptional regulator [Muribaculaceae bacterium]